MTQLSPTALEAAAKAIAEQNGDDIEAVPTSKSHWNSESGHFGGRFRTVNEPFRSDYEEQATAAITAYLAQAEKEGWVLVPRDLTPDMIVQGYEHVNRDLCEGRGNALNRLWAAMLAAAQNGGE
jgi:hypothetical protein